MKAALKRAVNQFRDHHLEVWAAALTYFGVLSIFPGLLVLVAVLGFLDESLIGSLRDSAAKIMPGAASEVVDGAIDNVRRDDARPGLAAIIGLLVALWSASGYVSAVWNIAKWPLLVLLVGVMLMMLYWAAPNARLGGFRWISPGGLLAVVLWDLISLGFGVYAANFGSYNETYGAVASVIVFLVWLWLTNLAVLFGVELDAELARQRAIAEKMVEKEDSHGQ